MTTHKDTDLREALRRRYADTPQLPEDFADRLMQRMDEKGKKPKRRILWLYQALAVAASVLLLLTLHYYYNNTETQDVVAQAQVSNNQPQDVVEQGSNAQPQNLVSNAQPLPSPQGEGQGVGSVNKSTKPSKKILTPPLTPPLQGRGMAAHPNSLVAAHSDSNAQPQNLVSNAHHNSQVAAHSDSIVEEKQKEQMDENLHYAAHVTPTDTLPYQDPSRVDDFIVKLAAYHDVKQGELTCSKTNDSLMVSAVYVFPDRKEIDVFSRLLQVACWYSEDTPGYFLSFSRQQFFFELKDMRRQLHYRWIAERINGKILLYGCNVPLGTETSSACYQEYRDELTHTRSITPKTKEI